MLANANAKANGDEPKWIAELYREVQGEATAAMRKEAQSLMPEFGGRPSDEDTATANGNPANELLLPASGGASPTSVPDPTPSAGNMTSGSGSPSPPAPEKIGVPVGFGDLSPGPAGPKP